VKEFPVNEYGASGALLPDTFHLNPLLSTLTAPPSTSVEPVIAAVPSVALEGVNVM
jgi:hypothetical protein